jgi:hypothetical protein
LFFEFDKKDRRLPDGSTAVHYANFQIMLVVITCPACRHQGHVIKRTLPRVLLCSRCGSRNRFGEIDRRSMAAHPSRPSFVKQSLLPDDLVQLLWHDHFRIQSEVVAVPAISG